MAFVSVRAAVALSPTETRFRLPPTSCAPSFIGALVSSSSGALAVDEDESDASIRDAAGMINFGALSVPDDDDDDDDDDAADDDVADDDNDDDDNGADADSEEARVDAVYIDDGCDDASATSGSDARVDDAIPERINVFNTDLALGIGW